MYQFVTRTNKLGEAVVSTIIDQEGREVAIITAEHHEEVATWLVGLMNEGVVRDHD